MDAVLESRDLNCRILVRLRNTMGSFDPQQLRREPLKRGPSIDHLEYVDVTPIIGREYSTARLKDMLNAPNAEEQLRDLAITICERGVVFFRAPQDDLSIEEQKRITDLLGKLTGRPPENGLHGKQCPLEGHTRMWLTSTRR